MKIVELLGKKIIISDGALGTMLQKNGLEMGELPEVWNITKPEVLVDIHTSYLQSGANIISTNTFGANKIKFKDTKYTVENIVKCAVNNVKTAVSQFENSDEKFIALNIGPTGKLLKPMGDLSFDDAYEAFKEVAILGEKEGVDLAYIETMSDTYELKSAVLAVKENTNLPVFATVTFDEKGKLLTGADVKCVVSLLEGLGVDALGINCGLGPVQMEKIVDELIEISSIPVIVTPNAGLPKSVDGDTMYDIDAEEFSDIMNRFAKKGVYVLGGCCGTTPKHIKLLSQKCKDVKLKPIMFKNTPIVSSYAKAVEIKNDTYIIGERINPTGKARFKQALRENDVDYILREAVLQQENNAHILDVNVGLPEIDEPEMLMNAVTKIQSILDIPLQIDTADTYAMEKALRYYNGKAMINSVNGKKESMEAVFPLVKKYGGVVVGLTLDENGIPDNAMDRVKIAEKIINTAKSYGIDKKDIVIDVLCMTVSSDSKAALITLEALKLVKEKLGVKTVLGVSNISFGLPCREIITANFYTLAMQAGLDLAIINPNSQEMTKSYYAYRALSNKDENFNDYIDNNSDIDVKKVVPDDEMTLEDAIKKGFKDKSSVIANKLLETLEPLEIINTKLIPALDYVGQGFEKGKIFLPQLLMSAEAAKNAFECIKVFMEKTGIKREKKGKIILATVKGDIHDIGKNIVKVLLENYDFEVCDLGKDVPVNVIVDKALELDIKLVGLSALMTTTVASMADTIKALKQHKPDCKIMVGGAVLTQEYADMINADFYGKDAMASVSYAQKIFK